MNVTRTVLPIMRKQRDGHVITLSSSAGLIGQEFCVAYAERLVSICRRIWSGVISSK